MMRSVDIKQVVVQSNPMERVQQTQQQHPEMQQRYLDIQLGEEKKLGKESVHLSEESEQSRRREKGKGKGERGEHDGRDGDPGPGREPEAAAPEDQADGSGTGHIDIRV